MTVVRLPVSARAAETPAERAAAAHRLEAVLARWRTGDFTDALTELEYAVTKLGEFAVGDRVIRGRSGDAEQEAEVNDLLHTARAALGVLGSCREHLT